MNWKVVLALLTCNVLFMSASYTMIIPFLPMYLTTELGVDDASVNLWSGLAFSVTFLISAVMAPIWGRIADRKGKRLMAMRASLLIAISYLLGGLVTSPEQLIIAIMTLYAPQEKLGFSLGIMQGTLTAGGVVGPLLGGVLAELFGMRTSFYIGGLALFINFLAFTFIIKEPPMPKETAPLTAEERSPMHLWHIPILRTMMIVSTLAQVVLYILMPVLTSLLRAQYSLSAASRARSPRRSGGSTAHGAATSARCSSPCCVQEACSSCRASPTPSSPLPSCSSAWGSSSPGFSPR